MKIFSKLLFLISSLIGIVCHTQVIKCEETHYSLEYKEKKYSTYHYIESEYSMRGFQVFIVNDNIFEKIKNQIPEIFSKNPKQDNTDFYVLGISEFDKNIITETDEGIINKYIIKINEYRNFYHLSTIDDKEFLNKYIIRYINDENEICKYMMCKKRLD